MNLDLEETEMLMHPPITERWLLASVLLRISAPAERIPHTSACSMLTSWMLTLLPDLQASDHLWATEQHRIITASHSASLSHHANTHS